jgi:hypothetical protein
VAIFARGAGTRSYPRIHRTAAIAAGRTNSSIRVVSNLQYVALDGARECVGQQVRAAPAEADPQRGARPNQCIAWDFAQGEIEAIGEATTGHGHVPFPVAVDTSPKR